MIKLLFLFFLSDSQCSMLLLVICGGFNSRRFSYANILIVLSPHSQVNGSYLPELGLANQISNLKITELKIANEQVFIEIVIKQ